MNKDTCFKAIQHLVGILKYIYYTQYHKKITSEQAYNKVVDFVFHGKMDKSFTFLFQPLQSSSIPMWYTGFNYDKDLLKELNTMIKNVNGYTDWDINIVHQLKKHYTVKKKEWVLKDMDQKCGGPSGKQVKPFYKAYSIMYTKTSLEQIKKTLQKIISIINIDVSRMNDSYFFNTELPTLMKYNTENMPLYLINKKQNCKEIEEYINKTYPTLTYKCINCKNLTKCVKNTFRV
jgi:hypothetical protein